LVPALVFIGLLLVAANLEYNSGNTFGATAFGTYAGFFLAFSMLTIGMFYGFLTATQHAHLIGMMVFAFALMKLV
jgi:succinate-acetate transporter protein